MRRVQVLEAPLAQHQTIETRLVADALGVTQSVDLYQTEEVDELFDRWEMKISESEMIAEEFDSMDAMEKKFLDEEEQMDLRTELQEIIAEKGDQP